MTLSSSLFGVGTKFEYPSEAGDEFYRFSMSFCALDDLSIPLHLKINHHKDFVLDSLLTTNATMNNSVYTYVLLWYCVWEIFGQEGIHPFVKITKRHA